MILFTTVLGPILFNIYISPLLYLLDEYPDIHFHSYADDLQLYCNLPDPINNINTINKCINDIVNGFQITPYY